MKEIDPNVAIDSVVNDGDHISCYIESKRSRVEDNETLLDVKIFAKKSIFSNFVKVPKKGTMDEMVRSALKGFKFSDTLIESLVSEEEVENSKKLIFNEEIFEKKDEFSSPFDISDTSRIYNITIRLNIAPNQTEKLPNPTKELFTLKYHLTPPKADIPSTITSGLSSLLQRHPNSQKFIVQVQRADAFEKFKCPTQVTVYNERVQEDQVFELSSYIALVN